MEFARLTIGTVTLIVITACTSFLGFRRTGFMDRYLFDVQAVLSRKEYRRLITSGFLHADWVHYGFNAFSLFSFGCAIESTFGLPVLALIFLSSVIGGNLLALLFHRNHEYRALGASGGVCGLIFAAIFLFPGGSVGIFPSPIPIPAPFYAMIFILASVFGIRTARDNIGHDAHLGGAMIGLFITTIFHPGIVARQPVLYVMVMALSISLIYVLIKMPLLSFNDIKNALARSTSADSEKRLKREKISRMKHEERIDDILEKISQTGVGSLTKDERKTLERESDKKKREHGGRERRA